MDTAPRWAEPRIRCGLAAAPQPGGEHALLACASADRRVDTDQRQGQRAVLDPRGRGPRQTAIAHRLRHSHTILDGRRCSRVTRRRIAQLAHSRMPVNPPVLLNAPKTQNVRRPRHGRDPPERRGTQNENEWRTDFDQSVAQVRLQQHVRRCESIEGSGAAENGDAEEFP